MLVGAGVVSHARAIDYYWDGGLSTSPGDYSGIWDDATLAGGLYETNWDLDGGATLDLPGAADTANFDLGQTDATRYTVRGITTQNDWLSVQNDAITLDLGPGVLYELLNTSSSGGVRVGTANGDTGDLILTGGGTLEGRHGTVGSFSGSVGRMAVTGAGTTWTNHEILRVGGAGTGSLDIRLGGQVTSARGWIARFSGSVGDVTVNGLGSSWIISGDLDIGGSDFSGLGGAGTLRVQADGVVEAGDIVVYEDSAIDLAGGTLNANGGLELKGGAFTRSSSGIFNLAANQTFHANNDATIDIIGSYSVEDNTSFTIASGSVWTQSGHLQVGNSTEGSLAIESGTVNSLVGVIGLQHTSSGAVTVAGSGATWSNSGNLRIAQSGDGILGIGAGGLVSVQSANIGMLSGSTGDVNIVGNNARWEIAQDLHVAGNELFGAGGMGTLDIRDQAVAEVTGDMTVWAGGEVMIDDGVLNVAGDFAIDGGKLTLNFESGSAFNFTGQTFTATNSAQVDFQRDFYSLKIDGGQAYEISSMSEFFLDSRLVVGAVTTGSLQIASGGWVRSSASPSPGLAGVIADHSGSVGTVLVTGAGSRWSNSDGLSVGLGGDGTLTVEAGGSVISDYTFIGQSAGSMGALTVRGAGSRLTMHLGAITVGGSGVGTLDVEAGGVVINADGFIGASSGSMGTVTITGAGSAWRNTNDLYVGGTAVAAFSSNAGVLNVEAGGELSSKNAYVAASSSATGTVLITGADSAWTNTEDLYLGGSIAGGGTAELTIQDSARVEVGGTLTIWSGGTLNLADSTLVAGEIDDTHGGSFNFTSGVLAVETFTGHLTNAGGIVSPGSSPGTTFVTGDYFQEAGGTLAIEIGGTSDGDEHDFFEVDDDAYLAGTLDISLINAFEPELGDRFDIMDWGTLTGTFDTVLLPTLTGGLGWNLDDLYLTGELAIEVAALLGDYSDDGFVGAADLDILLANWGDSVSPGDLSLGDGSGDGLIGQADLDIVLDNWGAGSPPPGVVPEPGSLAAFVLAGLTLIRRRR